MGAPPRYNPAHGWRLDRIPGRRVQRVEDPKDGQTRYVLPLMILLNGTMRGESGIWMSGAELEALHAELCLILAGTNTEKKQALYCAPAHSRETAIP
ncbi:hypothetical protein ACFWGL_12365 [Streptomyces sp. NPDC060286]|uniref:hypothetical protein n=1 Tax=unclassified Streptomyces TaxID=2593676 RepID=UPI0035E0A570